MIEFSRKYGNEPGDLTRLAVGLVLVDSLLLLWLGQFDPPAGITAALLAAVAAGVFAVVVWNGYGTGKVALTFLLACGVVGSHGFVLSAGGVPEPHLIVAQPVNAVLFSAILGLGAGVLGHSLGWTLDWLRHRPTA